MDRSLREYRNKRDFGRTLEPSGRRKRNSKHSTLRYVIQKHDARRTHFDFRLEYDGVLKSWAVTRGPSLDPSEKRLAVRVEDHPLDYGDFEGRIPKGQYGGGTVMLWDEGTWEPEVDPEKGLREGKLKFSLHGRRLSGGWALVRMCSDRGKKPKKENWLLVKERDDKARGEKKPIIETARTSVRTGRNMDEIAAGDLAGTNADGKRGGTNPASRGRVRHSRRDTQKLPGFIKPQLCTLVEEVPAGDGWIHEIKFDGYRAVSSIAGDKIAIHTRNGLDWTDKFPAVADALSVLPCRSAVVDGEIAVGNSHKATDFGALQEAIGGSGKGIGYYIFDLLRLDGVDLREEPLLDRKVRLEALLGDVPTKGPLFFSDHVVGKGNEVFRNACDLGLEGVVSKRSDAPYRSGRSRRWVKIKCGMGQEFVIVGWCPSKVRGRHFSSILVAVRDGDKLTYKGRVGSGFSEAQLNRLWHELKKLAIDEPAVAGVPAQIARQARFVKPDLVAEIAFRGWTSDGLVRQGSFKGLRSDKDATDIVTERPRRAGAAVRRKAVKSSARKRPAASRRSDSKKNEAAEIGGVRVTHPDRVLFPEQGVTKRALADYYLAIADRMLPHILERPISLVRCPAGREGECFFQKHASAGFPREIRKIRIKEKSGFGEYLYIEDEAGLVAAVQMGVLELHIWGSHIDTLEKPDRLVFDLDPDVAIGFARVRESAIEMRNRLSSLGLESFAMATGGKGIHVVAPLAPKHTWDEVKNFAEALARTLANESPDLYLAKASKTAREDRIFIDYLRNGRGATAIAPYSSRARQGAPVAWPVSWQSLSRLQDAHPHSVATAVNATKRQKGDPWKDYFSLKQELPRL